MNKYILILFLFLISCKDVNKDNCNVIKIQKIISDIRQKYAKDYIVTTRNKEPLDFVDLYTSHCQIECKKDDYNLQQALEIFDENEVSLFYCELICFKDTEKRDSIIKQIKIKNCIDPYNIKINKIFKLNAHLAIFVNYSDFNINDFQREILSKYKECEIIDINIP